MGVAPRAAGGQRKKVLWANAAPVNQFAEQTITVPNLNEYIEKGYPVYCSFLGYITISTVFVARVISNFGLIQGHPTSSVRVRGCKYDGNDKITFSYGYLYGNQGGINNGICVPQEIYTYV